MQGAWVRSLGQEDSPGEGNGNPMQYSRLGNHMDRGAWWATVHGVTRVRHDWPAVPHEPFYPMTWYGTVHCRVQLYTATISLKEKKTVRSKQTKTMKFTPVTPFASGIYFLKQDSQPLMKKRLWRGVKVQRRPLCVGPALLKLPD